MKKTHNLFLMECIFALLLFSLAAALCAQLFGKAILVSRETERLREGVHLAQSAGEAFRFSGGDLAETARLLGGEQEDASLLLFREKEGEEYVVRLARRESSGVAYGEIQVLCEEKEVYSLTVGCALPLEAREVSP